MKTQSYALKVADLLDDEFNRRHKLNTLYIHAAAELRRLNEMNSELVDALRMIQIECDNLHHSKDHRHTSGERCRAKLWIDSVLAKAQGENND